MEAVISRVSEADALTDADGVFDTDGDGVLVGVMLDAVGFNVTDLTRESVRLTSVELVVVGVPVHVTVSDSRVTDMEPVCCSAVGVPVNVCERDTDIVSDSNFVVVRVSVPIVVEMDHDAIFVGDSEGDVVHDASFVGDTDSFCFLLMESLKVGDGERDGVSASE